MKKIFCLIATLILIAGCDDGDMTYKSFDFSNVENPTACTNNTLSESTSEIYYKINNTEGLVLSLAKSTLINSPTTNPETQVDTPRIITLSSSNSLTYYEFANKPSQLCTTTDLAANTEKWTGQGTLSVSTFALTKDDKLIGYTHQITIQNVSFTNGSGETITISNNLFGNIKKEFGFTFNFDSAGEAEPVVEACTSGTLLFTRQDKQALLLNITDFATYFDGTLGTKTINIPNPEGGADEATVQFNVYSSSVSKTYVCSQGSDVPALPLQKWQLLQGSIVIVTTTGTGGGFDYNIYLKDATFASLTNSQDTFVLNEVIEVENENGYFFGKFSTN